MIMNPLISSYVGEKAVMGWSAQTQRLRVWQISDWEKFCIAQGLELATAERATVVAYLATKPSATSRRGCLAGIRGFYEWCVLNDHFPSDPAYGLQRPSVPRGVPRPIPDALFARALVAAPARERSMLLLARFAGLRCIEIGSAHSSWLISGVLHVPGKGGHVDPVPAHPRVTSIFEAVNGWLFPSHSSKRKVPHLLANSVTHIGNKHLAVYAPGWTMHKLRHAFISEVYDDSGDLGVAQTAARHKSADTTRGYALLSDRRLRGIIDGLDGGLSPAA